MNIAPIFLKLLKSELWNTPTEVPALSHEQVRTLLRVSDRQAVTGLIVQALIRNNVTMEKKDAVQVFSLQRQIAAYNQQLNQTLNKLDQILRQKDIPYIVFKGQTIAALYPTPSSRVPGDIDFLCHRIDYTTLKEKLEDAMGVLLPIEKPYKETSFMWNDTYMELHTTLIRWANPRHRRLWERELEASLEKGRYVISVDGTAIPTLEPTLYVVYSFVHLFFHFVREGIGMRHLCDLALLLNRNEVELPRLRRLMTKLGLSKAFRAFGCLLVDKLGLPVERFPFELNDDDRTWARQLTPIISRGGNFGHSAHKDHGNAQLNKMETFKTTFHRVAHFYTLAPSELLGFIPKLAAENVRLMWQNMKH